MFVHVVDILSTSWFILFHVKRSKDLYCTISIREKRNAESLELVSCSVFTLVSILPLFILSIILLRTWPKQSLSMLKWGLGFKDYDYGTTRINNMILKLWFEC